MGPEIFVHYKRIVFIFRVRLFEDRLCGLVVRVSGYRYRGPGFDPRRYQIFAHYVLRTRPPLWSSGQSFWLQIQRSRVRSPALPHFLSSSGSGTGSTQPREVN